MKYLLSEIEDAYRKLKTYWYYDSTDLFARGQIAQFEKTQLGENAEDEIANLDLQRKLSNFFKKINQPNIITSLKLDKNKGLGIKYFIKKVEEIRSQVGDRNFYSDNIDNLHTEIRQINPFIECDIELQLLSILWLENIGRVLEAKLSDDCYANRLILAKNKIPKGRGMFKPYHGQYNKWWNNGLHKAKDLLHNANKEVILFNFDIRSFFPSIDIDEADLKKDINYEKLTDEEQDLHNAFVQLHINYQKLLKEAQITPLSGNGFSLPIGLPSSYLLANWYMNRLDKAILTKLNPDYFGRYVDDFFVVFKSIHEFNQMDLENDKIKFIKNYAPKGLKPHDKERLKSEIKITDILLERYFRDVLQAVIKTENGAYSIDFKVLGFNNLFLQKSKAFIYHLTPDSPISVVDKFIQEQQEKSSEFRFLMEENENSTNDFGELIFESAFDESGQEESQIKILKANKFKLSTYLTKLSKRIIIRGISEDYEGQADKIINYFKGSKTLEHYSFWEKIFTICVLLKAPKKFHRFLTRIIDAIDKSEITDTRFSKSAAETFKRNLVQYLIHSMEMALAINPKFHDEIESEINEALSEHYKLRPSLKKLDFKKFTASNMLRHHLVYFPLFNYTVASYRNQLNLADISISTESYDLKISKNLSKYSPRAIKFWEACWYKILVELNEKTPSKIDNRKTRTHEIGFIDPKEYLNDAFDLFSNINGVVNTRQKNKIFRLYSLNTENDDVHTKQLGIEIPHFEDKISNKKNRKIRIGIVNENVEMENYKRSMAGTANLTSDRIVHFQRILDEAELKSCDLFVQPELSLPYRLIPEYLKFCTQHKIGFISGIEHWTINNMTYNFILTALPVVTNGYVNDIVPILRLKNHYAPKEIKLLEDNGLVVPLPTPKQYHLFHWNRIYFTNYYCYELTNIRDRALFQSKIDVLFAPVWNADTNYFNSIVESSAREIHCYFIQVNTSQFGDSRLSIPAKTEKKNPITVKGGTTFDHRFTFSLADLDMEPLRSFQELEISGQISGISDFKVVPPEFDKENVKRRIKNEMFGDYIE